MKLWTASVVGALLIVFSALAHGDPEPPKAVAAPDSLALEPPPEAPEGSDFEIERADSLADASLEIGFGASGRSGERPRASRRVRFRGDGVSAQVREGAGDPLAGAALDARAAGGMWRAGRLAPRWGRGLVLGSAGSPWSRAALDRGDGAPYRGRAGDGLWYRRAGPIDLEALAGRFARRDLACLRVGTAGAGVGLLGARGGDLEWSVALERPGGDGEIAIERSGARSGELRSPPRPAAGAKASARLQSPSAVGRPAPWRWAQMLGRASRTCARSGRCGSFARGSRASAARLK